MLRSLIRRLLGGALEMKLKPGDPAPQFQCTDHLGNTVDSAQLGGQRYVLWFYPKADTPG